MCEIIERGKVENLTNADENAGPKSQRTVSAVAKGRQ